jgi:hypothetical protein
MSMMPNCAMRSTNAGALATRERGRLNAMEKSGAIPLPERKVRKALGLLICNVRCFEAKIDAEMSTPSDTSRGKRIASLVNDLIMQNDQALYFGLGFDFRKDGKTVKPNIKAIGKWSRRMYR